MNLRANVLITRPLRPLLTVAALLAITTPLFAQERIFSWRDANGTVTLTDRQPAPGIDAHVFVPATSPAPSTTPAFVGRSLQSDPAIGRASFSRAFSSFDHLIDLHASTQGVRPELVRAVIQAESGFNPFARSPKGAMGLMQLMPATAVDLGVRNAYDPADNIRGGVTYLRWLLDRYNSEELALAAYNAGPAAVERYGNRIPPYRETQAYVSRITRATRLAPLLPRSSLVYKVEETVGGRSVLRYSNVRPKVGTVEIVGALQ